MVAAAADDDENERPTLYNLAVILPRDTQMIQLYCLHAPCNSLYCFVECFSTTHLKYV